MKKTMISVEVRATSLFFLAKPKSGQQQSWRGDDSLRPGWLSLQGKYDQTTTRTKTIPPIRNRTQPFLLYQEISINHNTTKETLITHAIVLYERLIGLVLSVKIKGVYIRLTPTHIDPFSLNYKMHMIKLPQGKKLVHKVGPNSRITEASAFPRVF